MAINESAPVTRDEMGYWSHPDLPTYEPDETPTESAEEWAQRNGIETHYVLMEGDVSDERIDRMSDGDPNFSDWEPTRPDGEGWFLIAIGDTEDAGPIAWFARSLKHAA